MNQRIKILSSISALVLLPALAFAGEPVPNGTPSASTDGSPSTPDTSAPSMAAVTQQPIDSGQIQKVFGMDAQLLELGAMTPDQIRSLQQSLQEKGRYHGKIDGIVGPQTRAGLMATLAEQYALTQRLIGQGQITGQLASSLGLNSEFSNVRGVDNPSLDSNVRGNGDMMRKQPGDTTSPTQRETDPAPATPPAPSSNAKSPLYPSLPEDIERAPR